VGSDKRQAAVERNVELRRTPNSTQMPLLRAVERQRLETDVELVDEKLGPRQQFGQVADAMNANPPYEFSGASCTSQGRPLDEDGHELFSVCIS